MKTTWVKFVVCVMSVGGKIRRVKSIYVRKAKERNTYIKLSIQRTTTHHLPQPFEMIETWWWWHYNEMWHCYIILLSTRIVQEMENGLVIDMLCSCGFFFFNFDSNWKNAIVNCTPFLLYVLWAKNIESAHAYPHPYHKQTCVREKKSCSFRTLILWESKEMEFDSL